jgi:16S rRNA (adenine1518-N6/adenine1519-N6)-dimethyltransferase
MSLLANTLSLLKTYRITPNKRLGQNFIIDSRIFHKLEEYSTLNHGDVVLDVGAGLGFLTEYLANICKCVLAVEIEKKIVNILQKKFEKYDNVKVLEGNIINLFVPNFNKVISAPPYNISSKLFLWILKKNFDCAVLILQKDFINRILASVGSKDYGFLTVIGHYYVKAEFMNNVSKHVFYPQPKVDSAIIRLKPKKLALVIKNESFFKKLVKYLFTNRNRKVEKAIKPFLKTNTDLNIDEFKGNLEQSKLLNERVRNLTPEEFGMLANAIN